MKQTVKRLLGLLLAASLLGGSALAANAPYAFEDFDMEVTVPEGDYYILTRDMDPDSPTPANVGMTAEQVNGILEGGSIYLDALYYDASYELTVIVLEGEDYQTVFNYDLLSKMMKDATASEVKRELERQGFEVRQDISWTEENGNPFLVIEMGPTEATKWSYQYQTVYNGRLVAASANSVFLEEPTDEIREQVKRLAQGIRFTRKLPTPESVLEAYQQEDQGGTPWLGFVVRILGAALIGAAVVAVYQVLSRRKKKKSASPAEDQGSTGGDER